MFLLGYKLIASCGRIPLMSGDKYRKRWDATMHTTYANDAARKHVQIVKNDNPVYITFIGRANVHERKEEQLLWTSDALSAYMFLSDNAK